MAHRNDDDVQAARTITILKEPAELYRAWQQPENLVRFVAGARSVDVLDDTHWLWTMEIPGLGIESWTSEITDNHENERLAWRSVDNPAFAHEGAVHFRAASHHLGTEVRLEIKSRVPGGTAAHAAARLLRRSPEDYIVRTLRNFKQLVETGEVATNQGPAGHRRIMTGVAPKVAAAGTGAAVLLTTLYVRSRRARRKD